MIVSRSQESNPGSDERKSMLKRGVSGRRVRPGWCDSWKPRGILAYQDARWPGATAVEIFKSLLT
jgi:hypothetical protein